METENRVQPVVLVEDVLGAMRVLKKNVLRLEQLLICRVDDSGEITSTALREGELTPQDRERILLFKSLERFDAV